MSYDINLEINTGLAMVKVTELKCSISANYSKLLKALFSVDSFYEMSMWEADMLIPALERAIESLKNYDTWESFIPYHKGCSMGEIQNALGELLELCRNHPKCTVVIY